MTTNLGCALRRLPPPFALLLVLTGCSVTAREVTTAETERRGAPATENVMDAPRYLGFVVAGRVLSDVGKPVPQVEIFVRVVNTDHPFSDEWHRDGDCSGLVHETHSRATTDAHGNFAVRISGSPHFSRYCVVLDALPPSSTGLRSQHLSGANIRAGVRFDTLRVDVQLSGERRVN